MSPFAPLGIVKLNTAAPLVHELVTEALVPGSQVVVVQTVIVAAAPVSPWGQVRVVLASVKVTVFQSVSPKTISFQLNAAELILAQVAHVSHCGHCSPWIPCSPCGHCSPCSHCGHVRVVLALARVTVFQSVSQNTISLPLKAAEFILAHVAQVSQVSHRSDLQDIR